MKKLIILGLVATILWKSKLLIATGLIGIIVMLTVLIFIIKMLFHSGLGKSKTGTYYDDYL